MLMAHIGRAAFGATLLLSVSFSRAAGVYEGTDLHNELQAYERIEQGRQWEGDYQLSAHAVGYVQGLGDLMVAQGNACPGASARGAQMVAVVGKFLKAHPDKWNEPAFMIIGESIHDAFPCTADKKPAK